MSMVHLYCDKFYILWVNWPCMD